MMLKILLLFFHSLSRIILSHSVSYYVILIIYALLYIILPLPIVLFSCCSCLSSESSKTHQSTAILHCCSSCLLLHCLDEFVCGQLYYVLVLRVFFMDCLDKFVSEFLYDIVVPVPLFLGYPHKLSSSDCIVLLLLLAPLWFLCLFLAWFAQCAAVAHLNLGIFKKW